MEKRGRGRPKKLELVTIDQALELMRKHLMEKYQNQEIVDRLMISKGTLYNKISQKKIINYGRGKGGAALLDAHEVLAQVG